MEALYLDDIEKELTKEAYYDFRDWFEGQTGLIKDGKFAIYTHDYERWKQTQEKEDGGGK